MGEIDLAHSMNLLMNIIELLDLDDMVDYDSSSSEINWAKYSWYHLWLILIFNIYSHTAIPFDQM